MCSPTPAIFESVWDYLFLQPTEKSKAVALSSRASFVAQRSQ